MATTTFNEKQWSIFCHLSSFAGFIIPFGNVLAPLVVWLSKKDQSYLVEEHGKEVVNFQISISIYLFFAGILCFILIGIPILILLLVGQVVLTIIAAIKADEGKLYKYPFTMRFIK